MTQPLPNYSIINYTVGKSGSCELTTSATAKVEFAPTGMLKITTNIHSLKK